MRALEARLKAWWHGRLIRGELRYGEIHFQLAVRRDQAHLLRDDYEQPLLDYLYRSVKPGDRVVDVGAHVGRLSLFLAQLVGPTGQVEAVEPMPDNCARIRDNVRRNGLGPVVTVREAVCAERTGEVELNQAPTSFEASLTIGFGLRPRRVASITLDGLASHRRIALVKVDVEGAEARVVQGATRLLQTDRPDWVLELHPPYAAGVPQLFEAQAYRPCDLQGRRLTWAELDVRTAEDDGVRRPFHIVCVPAERETLA